ncbi:SAM-dependent methyltransferase [Amycolatopsis sp. NPDC051102]|uniref:SAM-dependent methyltransferase n=1 Tax=Amycolatopsis sp. NPDC051102 TaxID=3155163 RepID=UPI0034486F39
MNAAQPADPAANTSRTPVGIDFTRPTIARIYNAFLGGGHNYGVDRMVCHKLRERVPEIADLFRSEVEFLHRAVRWIGTQFPIEQWVIAVAGPAPEGRDQIHDVIREVNSDAGVWYVDYEPVPLATFRTFDDMRGGRRVHVVKADPLDPDTTWDELTQLDQGHTPVDDREPICLVLGGVLPYHPFSRADIAAVTRQHLNHLPHGSFFVLTHLLDPEEPELTAVAVEIQNTLVGGPLGAGSLATRDEIEAMVSGATILAPSAGTPPSVVPARQWWAGPPLKPSSLPEQLVAGVVAAIPGD